MSIDYEIDDGVSLNDVLGTWPTDATAETDETLLAQLTTALETALDDAIDAGVESNEGFSTSDSDVPSIAQDPQNEHRSGFQLIVRVMAEIWIRLLTKSQDRATSVAERWRNSPFRLTRRLAMFSFSNTSIPAHFGAEILIDLPSGELFLTHSSVEVYRLIRARWKEFPPRKQQQILSRLREGPPRNWFRADADVKQHIDRARFDILSDMVRDGLDIGGSGKKLLAELQARWPQWQPRPAERAGFHIWSESGPVRTEIDRLKDIGDGELLEQSRRIAAERGFMVGDAWQALCQSDPDRALRGLHAAVNQGDWSPVHCERLLWSNTAYADPTTESAIAKLLLCWPEDSFEKVAVAASWWLHVHVKTMPDELIWPLWDRIASATLADPELEHE